MGEGKTYLEKTILNEDQILKSITADEIRTTIHCNGENEAENRDTFKQMLKDSVEDGFHDLTILAVQNNMTLISKTSESREIDNLIEQGYKNPSAETQKETVYNADYILNGITAEEVLDVSHCNGEDIEQAFVDSLKIQIEDAWFMYDSFIEQYKEETKVTAEEIAVYLDENGYDTQSLDIELCQELADTASEKLFRSGETTDKISYIENVVGEWKSQEDREDISPELDDR